MSESGGAWCVGWESPGERARIGGCHPRRTQPPSSSSHTWCPPTNDHSGFMWRPYGHGTGDSSGSCKVSVVSSSPRTNTISPRTIPSRVEHRKTDLPVPLDPNKASCAGRTEGLGPGGATGLAVSGYTEPARGWGWVEVGCHHRQRPRNPQGGYIMDSKV